MEIEQLFENGIILCFVLWIPRSGIVEFGN